MKLRAFVLALAPAALLLPAELGAGAGDDAAVRRAHHDLLLAVQDQVVPVTGSPALCEALGVVSGADLAAIPTEPGGIDLEAFADQPPGRQPDAASGAGATAARGPVDLAGERREQNRLTRHYFGAGACQLQYPVEIDTLVTRATTALAAEISNEPEARRTLAQRLAKATAAVVANEPQATDLQSRLTLQSLAWEIGLPLWRASQAAPPASTNDGAPGLRDLSCHAWNLARQAALSSEQVALVGSNSLAKLRGDAPQDLEPVISNVQAALTGEATTLPVREVTPPSDSHADALLGRFAVRIFLTAETPAGAKALSEFLDKTPFLRLGRMPLFLDDVKAILLLYVNALAIDNEGNPKIEPSNLVAFWQQYDFSKRVTLSRPDLPQAEKAVTFHTVRAAIEPMDGSLHYLEADQNGIAHKSFVEAMPPTGSPVTVRRGVCMRCHSKVVETFHPGFEREVELPLAGPRGGRELLTSFYREVIEQDLASWAKACAGSSPSP